MLSYFTVEPKGKNLFYHGVFDVFNNPISRVYGSVYTKTYSDFIHQNGTNLRINSMMLVPRLELDKNSIPPTPQLYHAIENINIEDEMCDEFLDGTYSIVVSISVIYEDEQY